MVCSIGTSHMNMGRGKKNPLTLRQNTDWFPDFVTHLCGTDSDSKDCAEQSYKTQYLCISFCIVYFAKVFYLNLLVNGGETIKTQNERKERESSHISLYKFNINKQNKWVMSSPISVLAACTWPKRLFDISTRVKCATTINITLKVHLVRSQHLASG